SCPASAEIDPEAQKDLARVAVEGRGDPFPAKAGDRVAVRRTEGNPGHRIRGEELVARRYILPVEDVLGVEADRVAVVGARPHQIGIPQSVARLVKIRARRFELEGLAAVR